MSAAWRPVATRRILVERAQLLALIRNFFAARGVQEMQTPHLSLHAVTDPNMRSMKVGRRYLQTSPEFHMKRLLAAYSTDLFQLTAAFRDDEIGRNHQPEFTMLEWYRISMSWRQLAEEVCELIEYLAVGLRNLQTAEFVSYQDAFVSTSNIDPLQDANRKLVELAHSQGLFAADKYDRDTLLEFLFDRNVVPAFQSDRLTIVYHFPASQAALARLAPRDSAVAERFECYLGEVELANGFAELTNANVQRHRFESDIDDRKHRQLEDVEIDERLLSALEHGLPDCAGVALGVDRLLQAILGKSSIEQVMAFQWSNA